MRLAVVDYERCSPEKCGHECVKYCPMNLSGVEAIVLGEDGKPIILEDVCTGCGICVKKCPFKAISIVNTPEALSEDELVHRYGQNGFALFRLPVPREGAVVGLVGPNGVGKTTSIRILAGLLKPNLGKSEASRDEIIQRFRGKEIQRYLERLASGVRASLKPQEIQLIPKAFRGTAGELLRRFDERGVAKELAEELFLKHLLDRPVSKLSGGELQRLAVAAALAREADIYFFDEPSSFLDIRERIRVAKAIRGLAESGKPVLVAEHDLAMLDYLSDYVHIYYGKPGAFGVVSLPFSSREGINAFLEGYIASENVRFRSQPLKYSKSAYEVEVGKRMFEYPAMRKTLDGFRLEVRPGDVREGEVIVILGPNGIGKTTFARLLVGELEPDEPVELARLRISYKPQYISPEGIERMTVRDFVSEANPRALSDQRMRAGILKPLGVLDLLDRELGSLSGGELQKAFIARTLVTDADIYLLDEPSAYVSAEDRVNVASVIRRVIRGHKAAFVIEHDLMISMYLADRVIVFSGEPGKRGVANPPEGVKKGLNRLLKELGITVRKEPRTGRPRINKPGSRLDREQRSSGEYFGARNTFLVYFGITRVRRTTILIRAVVDAFCDLMGETFNTLVREAARRVGVEGDNDFVVTIAYALGLSDGARSPRRLGCVDFVKAFGLTEGFDDQYVYGKPKEKAYVIREGGLVPELTELLGEAFYALPEILIEHLGGFEKAKETILGHREDSRTIVSHSVTTEDDRVVIELCTKDPEQAVLLSRLPYGGLYTTTLAYVIARELGFNKARFVRSELRDSCVRMIYALE